MGWVVCLGGGGHGAQIRPQELSQALGTHPKTTLDKNALCYPFLVSLIFRTLSSVCKRVLISPRPSREGGTVGGSLGSDPISGKQEGSFMGLPPACGVLGPCMGLQGPRH